MTEKAVGKNIDEPVCGHTFLLTFSIQNGKKICTPFEESKVLSEKNK